MRYLLSLLGSLEIRPVADIDEQPTLNRKTRAILAYLAATGELHTRRALAELFCQATNDPAGSLRWHLSHIRRQLGKDILHVSPQEIAINTAVARTDLISFQQTLNAPHEQTTEALAQAVNLYRGPFLDDLALRDAPEFDLWPLANIAGQVSTGALVAGSTE